ncbi:MAG: arylsulfatase, partial [Planctomycetaceae bacterium]|nr:arylsulfatase [Planctomycetaceae bacterium]
WTNPPLPVISTPPNIIFILADDLGYADVGFNGQTHFATPCLDRMAAEGMVFTQFYAGSTVCAPSRACLLTGQHTGHVFQRFNGPIQFREDDQDVTVARFLKNRGYQTAMIGKSGLAGRSKDALLPRKKGFDYFYGFLSHNAAHRYYPKVLWDNGQRVDFPQNQGKNGETYSGELFLQKSLDWIDEHRDGPFFLHVSLQQPHADLAAPAAFRNRHLERFEEQPYPPGRHYRAESHPRATFVGMVQYLDHSVGKILDKLVKLGIDDETYVFFSSDNGPHFEGGAHPDHFDSNGPLRGGKRDLFEGGIRVPFVAWAPGHIEPGSRSNHVAAFWDFPVTACELAGHPLSQPTDGISFTPALRGDHQPAHDYLYWEFYEGGGKQAVRLGDWKAVRLRVNEKPDGPIQLFDLRQDLGESKNIAAAHPAVVSQIKTIMRTAHQPHPNKPFGRELAASKQKKARQKKKQKNPPKK